MTVNQLASYIAISRSSVLRMVNQRLIPFIRLSPSRNGDGVKGMVRFDIERIDKWMRGKEVKDLSSQFDQLNQRKKDGNL